MDGIVCFAIEMSSATQNWLKMPALRNIVSRLFVRLIFSGSKFNFLIISDTHPFSIIVL